jgi:endoglucanase
MAQGYNMFRVPFLMERMALGSVGGSFSAAYLANYSATINYITNKGGYAIVDPHNFGRYNGAIITDTTAFKSFWTTLATAFKSNSKVVSQIPPHSFQMSRLTERRSSTPTTNTTTWIKHSS